MTHLTQTLFGYVSTFTRFKLADGSGPFVKVGGQTYQDSDGNLISIVPAEPVFQVPDEYKSSGSGGSPPLPPPFTDATHYWKCNEASGNLLDEISSLDLTVNGATQHISGPLDFALQVNGHGAAANAHSVPTPSIRSGGLWTVNFWTQKIGTLNQDDIFSQYNNFTNAGADTEFFMKSGVNSSGLSLYDGAASSNTNLTVPAGAFDGNWHMLTIRFGTTPNTLDFYLDGIAWGSATNSRSPNSTSTSIYFGQFNSSGAGTAQGIADVCIWPRAISDSEITMLYNGGTPIRPS